MKSVAHILKIPKLVSGIGALAAALRLRDKTFLVSAGSITPSSHNLSKTINDEKKTLVSFHLFKRAQLDRQYHNTIGIGLKHGASRELK